MNKITIVYVTSNREDPAFENLVKQKLLEVAGDHPLISVSQKPIDLGKNICVGDIGQSYMNAYRQLLVGAKAAETEFVMPAESDQLYPPGYFDFVPGDHHLYVYQDLWVLTLGDRSKFWKKDFGDWVVAIKRDYFISRLEAKIAEEKVLPPGKVHSIHRRFASNKFIRFNVGAPVITIKTDRNINKKTGHTADTTYELPHWGKADDLSKYFGLQ